MKTLRVLWVRRATTALTVAAVCLVMSSATGPGEETTASSTVFGAGSAAAVGTDTLGPGGTAQPASLTTGSDVRASASRVPAQPVSVGNGVIPDVALRAYQRAAVIIKSSDATCGLRWELLAAIGRVESDHGRYGTSVLNKQGRATPPIRGPVLDGTRGTAKILDTDAGLLDGDPKHDRAVGPMQFIPSTWSVAGVDADSDGKRNPQDIDDAALAAAVHLCAGNEDLRTAAGLRSAILRYNNSAAYADLVSSLFAQYRAGKYNASPTPTTVTIDTDRDFDTTPVGPTDGGPSIGTQRGGDTQRGGESGQDGPKQGPPKQDGPKQDGPKQDGPKSDQPPPKKEDGLAAKPPKQRTETVEPAKPPKPEKGKELSDDLQEGDQTEPPITCEPGAGAEPVEDLNAVEAGDLTGYTCTDADGDEVDLTSLDQGLSCVEVDATGGGSSSTGTSTGAGKGADGNAPVALTCEWPTSEADASDPQE